MSTQDGGAAGSGWSPPEATAPVGHRAAAGGQARPRGRRYSGRSPAGRQVTSHPAHGGTGAAGPAWPLTGRRDIGTGSGDTVPGGVLTGGIKPRERATAATASGGGPAAEGEPVSAPLFLEDASRAGLAWARRRHLGLSSATGIAVALGGCAAGWFSAGTSADMLRGAAALWCSYLVLIAGRSVARREADQRQTTASDHRVAGPVRWQSALGLSAAQAGVFAGLVVGAETQHWPGMWGIGIALVGLVTVRSVMTASSMPYGLRYPPETLLGRLFAAVATMAAGGRVLLIGVVAPIWGPRTTLLVLLAWAIGTVGWGLAGAAAPAVAAKAGGGGHDPAGAAPMLLRLRDDGWIARRLGELVRGKLLPMPPAILGLAAVSALALVGMHGLTGPLMIGPAVVMLLAAPGSANPHAGRFDWLAPVLLVSSQIIYLWTVGVGARVPGPAIYVLVAALLLRYTDLTRSDRPVLMTRRRDGGGVQREHGTELGWEGRVLFVGLTAALGIAAVGYVALSAYLAMLIGAKVVRSGFGPPGDDQA